MDKKETEYISLQEATQYCSYTQEYLSLRARQGKLKALKFGRNWVTKKEWLEEYLQRVEEYNNHLKNNSQKFVSPPENLEEVIEVEPQSIREIDSGRKKIKFSLAPMPMELIMGVVFVLFIAGGGFIIQQTEGNSELTEWIGKNSFQNVTDEVSPLSIEFSQGFDRGVANLNSKLKTQSAKLTQETSYFLDTVSLAGKIVFKEGGKSVAKSFSRANYQVAGIGEITDKTFKEYSQWLTRNLRKIPQSLVRNYIIANDFLEEKISQGRRQINDGIKMVDEDFKTLGQNLNYKFTTLTSKLINNYLTANNLVEQKLSSFIKSLKKIPQSLVQSYVRANDFVEGKISQGYKALTQLWKKSEKLIPESGEDGMVVIPSTEEDKEIKEKIKESFSDEVRVELEDKTSGIIIPIFRDGEGDKYLYILVPIKQ